ncbi:hypothetical protein Vretifemale_17931, partial [Volvox reticuliferus]
MYIFLCTCPNINHASQCLTPPACRSPKAYLLAAIKMHWYLHCLPGNLSRDPRVALSAIQSGICYMVALVRSRTDSEATNRRFGPGCRCNVSSCHVRVTAAAIDIF